MPQCRLRREVTPVNGAGAPARNQPRNRCRAPGVDEAQAQRLKRVFKVDIETCDACGGAVKLIASIDDPAVIEKILAHYVQAKGSESVVSRLARRPEPRAPPDVWN